MQIYSKLESFKIVTQIKININMAKIQIFKIYINSK